MGRMEKVNQLMKKEIGTIIQRAMKDPRLTFVTITSANVSSDLHDAKISFSVLGDSQEAEVIREILNHASGYIRKIVGRRITLRNTPHLEFVYDSSIEYSARIEKTLKEINEDRSLKSQQGRENSQKRQK